MDNLHEFDKINESKKDYLEYKRSWIEYEIKKREIKAIIQGASLFIF